MLVEVAVGVDRSDIASAVPIRLSPGGSAVEPIRSCGCQGDLSFELFDELAERRITLHATLNKGDGVNNGRVVAAEVLADRGKGGAANTPEQIHGDLTLKGDMLGAAPALELVCVDSEGASNLINEQLETPRA